MKITVHIRKLTFRFTTFLLPGVDFHLLIFLVLFLDVKVIVKVLAVIFMYTLRPDFKFGFRLKSSRLPLFYPAIIIIALLDFLFYRLYAVQHYTLVLLTGIFFWLLCILAIHQIKISVEKTDINIIHNTLLVFFLANAAVSFLDIIIIMIRTGVINPYLYQGLRQKYFIGTGDYIKGVFFDTSTTNAIINAFALIYFFKRKNTLPSLICMIVLLLTCSNLTNIILLVTFIFLFIFNSTKDEKSVISICIFTLILFLVKISPQNNQYSFEIFKNIFSKPLTVKPSPPPFDTTNAAVQKKDTFPTEQSKQLVAKAHLDSVSVILFQASHIANVLSQKKAISSQKPFIPKPDINEPEYQTNKDTTATQRELVAFTHKTDEDSTLRNLKARAQYIPGKLISLKQTIHFFQLHPAKIFTGSGLGNFSSKMAFRATALKVSGGYPQKYAYINNDFKNNHLAVFLYYFSMITEFHSVMNTPDSVIDQLFSEYGILGLAFFLIFYVCFFAKQYKKLTYGIPIAVIMSGAFFTGYWFEQLSVVIIFELLLLSDIKTSESKINASFDE